MKIAYRLRRTAEARSTNALLLPGRDSAALLQLCARLAINEPRVFAVTDGLLLRLDRPLDTPMAGAIRLHEFAPNLLLPMDAELIPPLLQDEAQTLGQRRGLIFLPGDRVLEFAPAEPIALSELIALDAIRRGIWQALPNEPKLARRISEITYHRPDDAPDAILEVGGAGIGEEEPRPEDASLPSKILGNSALGVGKGLRWLGGALNWKMLSDLGGKLMAGGLALAPRLSEQIMGKQEAGLRDLLEAFRNGDIEIALRRALPLGGAGTRGSVPHQQTQLPTHNLRYSLGNILGDWGPASLWYSPDQLYYELQREYRKQAEAAVQRGDYRRAAFIYGKLLNDYAMAATVLAQGGLHHDAAILYLKRLLNHVAAAREFEAAGEFDDALALYRQHREHVLAGDLLRRLGDDELALAEYTVAADLLVEQHRAYRQAGDVMLDKAQRPDLAANYFLAGWQTRPSEGAVQSAVRLAELHADGADGASLVHLTEEAEDFFQPPGNETLASNFFNKVAALAAATALASVREDLRDRCLMALARKLRHGFEQGTPLAAALFPAGNAWEAPEMADADRASRRPRNPASEAVAGVIAIPARVPVVRAVCQASEIGEIFLAFMSGEIACFDPGSGEVQFLPDQPYPVHQIAVDRSGTHLVSVSAADFSDNGSRRLTSYTRVGRWMLIESRVVEQGRPSWLCAPLAGARDPMALLSLVKLSGYELHFLRVPRLLPAGSIDIGGVSLFAGIPLFVREAGVGEGIRSGAILFFDGADMFHVAFTKGEVTVGRRFACGLPGRLESSSLDAAPLSCTSSGPAGIEVVGIGSAGALTWLDIPIQVFGAPTEVHCRSTPGPYKGAAILRPGVIAAVADDHMAWLRAGTTGIKEQLRQKLSAADPVACFAHNTTQEVFIVSGNGLISRVRQAI